MDAYSLFQTYLILMVFSVVIAVRALSKGDYETPGIMLVLFLCSLIGLACNYYGWVREFSGMYGIIWNG
jgi:hypothetical protein